MHSRKSVERGNEHRRQDILSSMGKASLGPQSLWAVTWYCQFFITHLSVFQVHPSCAPWSPAPQPGSCRRSGAVWWLGIGGLVSILA